MTDFTKTIEEIRSAYVKLLDPSGAGGIGIHEAVEIHMAKIADLKAEVEEKTIEKVLKMKRVAIQEREEVRNPYTTKAFVVGEGGKFELPPPMIEIRNLHYVKVTDIETFTHPPLTTSMKEK